MNTFKSTALISASLCLVAGAAQAQAQAQDTVSMSAVRAKKGDASEVRLLWTVTQGWLPSGGVNVFRSDKPTTALNTTPIVINAKYLAAGGAAIVNRKPATSKPLFGTGVHDGPTGAPLSSGDAFHAFKLQIQTLQVAPGTRANQLSAVAGKDPTVQTYRKLLKVPQPIAATAAPALTDDEATTSAHIQIQIASMTSYSAAQDCGMAYVDKTVRPLAAYTYTLKGIDGTVLATASVTATPTPDPPVPAPDCTQLGQGSVALHWEPMSAADEKNLISATYNVYRDGTKLNTTPVRIAYMPTTNNGHVATMATFVDNTAPQSGSANYTVTLTDAFGRTSAPGATTTQLYDLRVPAAVTGIVSGVSKTHAGAIRLFWYAPDMYSGDIAPNGLTGVAQPTAFDVYRSAPTTAETTITQSGPVPAAVSPGTNGLPPEFLDMTVAQFLKLDPGFAGNLTRQDPVMGQVISPDDLKAMMTQTMDKLYPRFHGLNQGAIDKELQKFQTYLDTPPTADVDYSYRVAPCYVINPTHHGTSARSAAVALPTATAPGVATGLAGTFQKGVGSFGFVAEGTAPTMRLQSSVGAIVAQSHFSTQTMTGLTAAPPRTPVAPTTGTTSSTRRKPPIVGLKPMTDPHSFLALHPLLAIAPAEKAPAPTIAGSVTLSWQAVNFTSPVRYRIYRAVATGLFPSIQTASLGAVPLPPLNTVAKIGSGQFTNYKDVVSQRTQITMKYFEDYTGVPNQDYSLLAETAKLQYTDTLAVSQRMHYLYRVIAVSRWGVVGATTPLTDVMIPATLPPGIPTLLKTQVDEGTAGGHVRLTISTNPAKENVAKYYIFRKPVSVALQASLLQSSTVRVATRRGAYAPPLPTLTPTTAIKNLNLKTITANNGTLMKSILNPSNYVKVGEVAATATPITPATATAPAVLGFTDTTGTPKVPYIYQVVAVNSDAISSKPSSPLDGTALKVSCAPPTQFHATLTTATDANPNAQTQVALTWLAPAGETSPQYVVERTVRDIAPQPATHLTPQEQLAQIRASTTVTSGPIYVTMTTTNTLQFVDSTVRSGREYIYHVRAVDADGLFSSVVPVTVDVPALAAVNFGDPPAPTGLTPDPISTTTLNPATNPVGPTTLPANPGTTTPQILTHPRTGTTTIGTANMPSKTAHFSTAYLVGGNGNFAVQVEKAAYIVNGYAIDAQNFYYCKPTEKFLKLTLLVKNVSTSPQPFDYQTVTAGGQTANGDDLAQTKNWKALDTNALANRTVPAGGQIEVEGVVTVPADGDPKTLTFGQDAFDLTDPANAITALTAQYGGSNTAAAEMPAKADGTFYSLAYTDGAVASMANEGNGFGVTLNIRNTTLANLSAANANYTLELVDSDGDKYPAVKSTATPVSLAPGAQGSLHFTFDCPKTIMLQSLRVRERDGRIYVFPVGAR